MADDMSIDKKESVKNGSEESMASSPEAEHTHKPTAGDTNPCAAQGANASAAQETQPIKRKGGRKPVGHHHTPCW